MQNLLQPCMQQVLTQKKKKKKNLAFALIVIASRSTTTIIPNSGVGNDGGYIKLVMQPK